MARAKGHNGDNSSADPPWLQVALAAAVVRRMQPNFELFCEVAGHPGARVFGNLMDLVWEFAGGTNPDIDFERQLDHLEAITPDPAQFDVYGVWPALDASVALATLLQCCAHFDASELATIPALSRATISGFLDASGAAGGDDHPLFQAEEAFGERLRRAARDAGAARRQQVAAIRALANAVTESNIGLSLD